MRKLPARFGMFLYGVLQAAMTTGVATAIATHTMTGFGDGFFQHWTKNWGIAWLTMLPLVVGVSPLIRRVVLAVTELPRGAPSASSQGTAPVARRT